MPGRRCVISALAGLGLVVLVTAGATAGQTAARPGGTPSAIRSPGLERSVAASAGLALGFVENRGQTDARVRYYAQGNRYAFYLTRDEVMLAFARKREARGLALALRFVGRDPVSEPRGAERAPGQVNYLRGNDPTTWQRQLGHYGQVVYRGLWPGIDLWVHQQAGALKYEFRVRPGGRPSDIRLAYAGARGVTLNTAHGLLIRTSLGVLRDSAPVSYQEISGGRVPVRSRYVLNSGARGNRGFGFAVGSYRADHDLVIDPGVEYTTFLGGSSHEVGSGI